MAVTDNLVAYYGLVTNPNDSVGSNNGTDINITYTTGTGASGCASFSGSSSRIIWPSSLGALVSGDFSVSFWVKPTSVADAQFFTDWNVGNRNIYILMFAGTLYFYSGNGSTSQDGFISTSTLSAGNIYHLTFTRSGTSHKIYINGSLDNSATLTQSGGTSGQPVTFGYYQGANSDWYSGLASTIWLHNRELTSGEVSTLYNSGTPLEYTPSTIKPNALFFSV